MYKYISIVILFLGSCQASNAQIKKTEDFNIVQPVFTTASNFGHLVYIDSRKDTTNYGIVQKGAFNKRAMVQPKIQISEQFRQVFESLKAPNVPVVNDTLVIQLRDMKFAETTEAFSEIGYFYIRAVVYHKSGSKYHRVFDTDLIEKVSAMDVTQKNYKNASKIINDFIAKAMVSPKDKTSRALTLEEVFAIDSIEKQSYPLYANEKYVDGLYMNYNNFRDQTPNNTDFKIERNKKGKIKTVTYKNFQGDYVPIDNDLTYAVVENGVPYIATPYGYYELFRRDDDFFYVGKVKVAADTAAVVAATMMFGIIGGLIVSNSDNSDTYEIMIDHVNGTTILQQKMKQ